MSTNESLKDFIKTIPKLPGIYKMLDSKGSIIYVGKSLCLNKRVKSYFAKSPKWEKVTKMVSHINSIEYIVTDTHLEARLLECTLIKSIRPFFNSQLKNEKGYIYLNIEDKNFKEPLNYTYHRKTSSIGPIRSKSAVRELIYNLNYLYPIALPDVPEDSLIKEYSFEFHILPVVMTKEQYIKNRDALNYIFSDANHLLILKEQLEDYMTQAAISFKYETAAIYRNLISSLTYLSYIINHYKEWFEKKIVVKIPTDKGWKVFFIHKGLILAEKSYIRLTDYTLTSFIKKYKDYPFVYDTSKDEKTRKDFTDIIYSELLHLPKENVFFI